VGKDVGPNTRSPSDRAEKKEKFEKKMPWKSHAWNLTFTGVVNRKKGGRGRKGGSVGHTGETIATRKREFRERKGYEGGQSRGKATEILGIGKGLSKHPEPKKGGGIDGISNSVLQGTQKNVGEQGRPIHPPRSSTSVASAVLPRKPGRSCMKKRCAVKKVYLSNVTQAQKTENPSLHLFREQKPP